MSLTKYFKTLGAPLHNTRWSWGAVRDDGTVILRVWQDESKVLDGVSHQRITFFQKFEDDPDNRGFKERQGHLELIKAGAKSYMVMCIAKDVAAMPRQVKSYIKDAVFEGGELREIDGDFWLERKSRIQYESMAN